MLISIITINFNNESGLIKTIESVRKQRFTDYEFIVIDADSKDNSKQIITANSDIIDKAISESDSGRYDGMNKGIKLSKGDYLLFLNSGDSFIDDHVLEKISYKLNEKCVYYGNILIENSTKTGFDRKKYDDRDINLNFFINNALPHQATFFHKSVFSDLGFYNTDLQIYGDLDLYLRILKANIKIKHVEIDIAFYDLNGISSNLDIRLDRNNEKMKIFENNFHFPSINFFTIVLNGMPFINYHIEVFKRLPFKWTWHIVEGGAELKHDTAWSVNTGGHLDKSFMNEGLSTDGTTEYLDELQKKFPDNVIIYRKKDSGLWDGKLEMVNAPLSNIQEECILWQLDSDELWTLDQIIKVRELFMLYPEKTAAYFFCRFFVGKNKILLNYNSYANNPQQEWLRVWRFKPGDNWTAHEPPTLSRKINELITVNVAKVNPIMHDATSAAGLIFQHMAYVMPSQIAFKEKYYGYHLLSTKWTKLNSIEDDVYLKNFFEWVTDKTLVTNADKINFKKICKFDNDKISFDYDLNCYTPLFRDLTFRAYDKVVTDYTKEINRLTMEGNTVLSQSDLYLLRIIEKFLPKKSKRRRVISQIFKKIIKLKRATLN